MQVHDGMYARKRSLFTTRVLGLQDQSRGFRFTPSLSFVVNPCNVSCLDLRLDLQKLASFEYYVRQVVIYKYVCVCVCVCTTRETCRQHIRKYGNVIPYSFVFNVEIDRYTMSSKDRLRTLNDYLKLHTLLESLDPWETDGSIHKA